MFIIPVVRMYQGLVHIFLISDFYDVSQTSFNLQFVMASQ